MTLRTSFLKRYHLPLKNCRTSYKVLNKLRVESRTSQICLTPSNYWWVYFLPIERLSCCRSPEIKVSSQLLLGRFRILLVSVKVLLSCSQYCTGIKDTILAWKGVRGVHVPQCKLIDSLRWNYGETRMAW